VRSIRVLQKIIGDPYYEPTIVVHDKAVKFHHSLQAKTCSGQHSNVLRYEVHILIVAKLHDYVTHRHTRPFMVSRTKIRLEYIENNITRMLL